MRFVTTRLCTYVLPLLTLFGFADPLAAQITVDSIDDDGGPGDCELREAIINANNDDQSGSADCSTGSGADFLDLSGLAGVITSTQGEFLILSDMTIHGPGSGILTVDGNQLGRVFSIPDSLGPPQVTIDSLTITGGLAVTPPAPGNDGGGILNEGSLTLNEVVITNNVATYGSGIHNSNTGGQVSRGILNITNSTISNNSNPDTTFGNGGGINNNVGGVATIVQSTISGNTSNVGGGIYNGHEVILTNSTMSGNTGLSGGGAIYTSVGLLPNDGVTIQNSTISANTANNGGGLVITVTQLPDTADVTLFSSIVAGNTSTGFPDSPDIDGPVKTSLGLNLIGDSTGNGMMDGFLGDQVGTNASPIDPMLGPLVSSSPGIHIPLGGSPAIDTGSCGGLTVDQRGEARPQDLPDGTYPNTDDGCDIGSVEVLEAELPVELADFTATWETGQVALRWTTYSESDNAGFDVEHQFESGAFEKIGFVVGAGSSDQTRIYSFELEDPEPGLHRFRLKQVDFDGAFEYSPIVEVFVDVPGRYLLSSAYPNPVRKAGAFDLVVSRSQNVRIDLFDTVGRVVRTLVDREVAENRRVEIEINVADLPAGTYFFRAVGENFVSDARSITVLR